MLAYTLYLTMGVVTQRIERKEAMRKSFVVSFLIFMFMFFVYLLWQDVSKLDFSGWITVMILITGVSTFGGLAFALPLLNWKIELSFSSFISIF